MASSCARHGHMQLYSKPCLTGAHFIEPEPSVEGDTSSDHWLVYHMHATLSGGYKTSTACMSSNDGQPGRYLEIYPKQPDPHLTLVINRVAI